MKVLLIGGTGFIGKALARLLVQKGHSVALFHRHKGTLDASLEATEIIGSRQEIIRFKDAFLSFKPDLVIDTIAYTAQDIWGLQMALKGVANNLLLLGSADVYKAYDTFHKNLPDVDNTPITETSELRHRLFPYKPSSSDQYNELLFNYDKIVVETMVDRTVFNICVLRLPAVFGPGDKQNRFLEYIQPMLEGKPFIEINATKANWVWTRSYVDNVAYGIHLAATNEKAKGETFNLGDIHLTEVELVTKLKELTGWKGEIVLSNNATEPYNYEQHLQTDSRKIRKLLAYREPVDLETALQRTIQYYRK
jgi:nucleoside-diphosphate-sugar epimerase